MTTPLKYLLNCFLLILPALIVNLLWASRLPPMWQFDRFWQEIPPWLYIVLSLIFVAVHTLHAVIVYWRIS